MPKKPKTKSGDAAAGDDSLTKKEKKISKKLASLALELSDEDEAAVEELAAQQKKGEARETRSFSHTSFRFLGSITGVALDNHSVAWHDDSHWLDPEDDGDDNHHHQHHHTDTDSDTGILNFSTQVKSIQ